MDARQELEELRRLDELESRAAITPAPTPEISQLQSAGKGAIQGATAGFGDEIAGGIDALLSKTGTLFTGDAPNPYADQPIADVYKSGRNEVRQDNAQASEVNPLSYLGGMIGGGAALPGTGSLKGMTALGGASGLGLSNQEDIAGMAGDTAKGAGIGLLGGLLTRGTKTLPQAAPAAKGPNAGWDFPVRNDLGEAVKSSLPSLSNQAPAAVKSNFMLPQFIKDAASGPAATVAGVMSGGKSIPVTEAIRSGIVEKGINGAIDASKAIVNKTANSRFAPLIQKAAQSGGNQLAVQHFLLGNKDAEYQDITKDDK